MKTGRSALILGAVFLLLGIQAAQAAGNDQSFMHLAFEQARAAIKRGDPPFGAVLVKNGRVLVETGNTAHTDKNCLHHAETNALAEAVRRFGPKAVTGSTLYTSCEPCAMCCGAIYIEGVKRVVYGMAEDRLVDICGWQGAVPAHRLFKVMPKAILVTGPFLEEQAAKIMREYLRDHPEPAECVRWPHRARSAVK